MKLVHNARDAWRWFSVRILALIVAVTALWEAVPVEVQAMIPEDYRAAILAFLAFIGIVGRLIDQTPKDVE
jgi:hypothetical protein